MAEHSKRKMPTINNHRESISFLDTSVLDSSEPKKLAQFLREKRGLRNAEPIFYNPSANGSKRESFPIEIESATTGAKGNENNKNTSNVDQPLVDNNLKPLLKSARVSLHRLSNNLRRRVLVKDFEQQLHEEEFCPAAASTPIQEAQNRNDDVSRIADNDGTIIHCLSKKQIVDPKFDKTNTSKQAKIMSESVLFQTEKVQSAEPINNCKDQTKTKMCNETIAVDGGVHDYEDPETLTNEKQSSTTKYIEEEIIEETLINHQNISLPQLQISHTHNETPNITNKPKRSLLSNKSPNRESSHQNNAKRISVEKNSERVEENAQSSEASRNPYSEAERQELINILTGISENHSQMEGLPTNILAPNTPKQQQNLPSAEPIHDTTVIIPPTQNEKQPDRYSMVVIPIYPPCSKEVSKSVETVSAVDKICPCLRTHSTDGNAASYKEGDDFDLHQEKSNVSRRKKQHSKRSCQTIEAEMTSDDDIASDNPDCVEKVTNNNRRDDAENLSLKRKQSGVIELEGVVGSRRTRQRSHISGETNSKQLSSRSNTNVNHAQYSPHTSVVDAIPNFLRNISSNCSGIEPIQPSTCNSTLDGTNWDAIEPLNVLSTSKSGVVYDMSPQTGQKWVKSILKKSVNKKSKPAAKRGKSIVSKKTKQSTLPYLDASTLQQSLKNTTIGNNKRKLYSKGNSDNDSSFEQSPKELSQNMRNNEQFNMLEDKRQSVNKIPLAKNKDKKRFKRIRRNESTDSEGEQTHHRNKTPSSVTEDDNHLFKIPQEPVRLSKKSVGNYKHSTKKPLRSSKMTIVSKGINNADSSDSSSSATDSHEESAELVENAITQPKATNSKNDSHKSKNKLPVDPAVANKMRSTKTTKSRNITLNGIEVELKTTNESSRKKGKADKKSANKNSRNTKKNHSAISSEGNNNDVTYEKYDRTNIDPDVVNKKRENSIRSKNINPNAKKSFVNPSPQPSSSLTNDERRTDEIKNTETLGQSKTINESSRKKGKTDKKSADKNSRKTKKNHSVMRSEGNNNEVMYEKYDRTNIDPDVVDRMRENSTRSKNITHNAKNANPSPQPASSFTNDERNTDEIENTETLGQLKTINESSRKKGKMDKKSADKNSRKTKKNHSALRSEGNNNEVMYEKYDRTNIGPDVVESLRENSTRSKNITPNANSSPQPPSSFTNDERNTNEIENIETLGQSKAINDSSRKKGKTDKKSVDKNNKKTKKNHSALRSEGNNYEVMNQSQDEIVVKLKKTAKRKNENNNKVEMPKPKIIKLNNETVESDVNSISGVRRSTRKHRPPRAYWTNRRDLDRTKISYSTIYVEDKLEPPKAKPRKIKKQSDATIVEHLGDLNASQRDLFGTPEKTNNCNIPETIYEDNETETIEPNHKDSTDDLFGRLKKTKNYNMPKRIHENNETEATETSNVPTSTSANSEENINGSLSWLRDFIQQKADSYNVASTIYNLSNIIIAPGNDLVFRNQSGIHYAFYNRTESTTNCHGFMRFSPLSEKSRTKSKLFNLIILNLLGTVELSTNEKQQIIKNADLVTVPKGTLYSLKNISRSEPALLFFMQSQVQ